MTRVERLPASGFGLRRGWRLQAPAWRGALALGAVLMLEGRASTSGLAGPQAGEDASRLVVSAPRAVLELEQKTLKGLPARLSWSGDGQQFYLQVMETGKASSTVRHYLVGLDGRPPAAINEEPPWAGDYWQWKSGRLAPGLPGLGIEIEQRKRFLTGTSVPRGGDLARGSPDGSSPQSVGPSVQVVPVITLRVRGQKVGEFVNAPAVPGQTFGWGPAGTGLIAFSDDDSGRLVIMDDQGRKQEVSGSKSALFPAWTNDGKRLAYLEKTARKKFQLKIVDVTRPAA